ncbi:hypothetical protein [Nocardia jejuensis]|uniref:hypothetical protein n=1 Tax=Nocardia jejuensis TaxID=328049 RepID=UPI0008332EBC|nr:hypothetical protein [Nocardia jejuensis]
MTLENRSVRTGLAALTLAAALTVAAPAYADIPLDSPTTSTTIADSNAGGGGSSPETGSAHREDGTTGGGSGSNSGSSTGSGAGSAAVAPAILKALDFKPCLDFDNPHQNSILASTVALILSLATGIWYVSPGCPS